MNTCTVCLRGFQPDTAASTLGHDACIAVDLLEEYADRATAAEAELEDELAETLRVLEQTRKGPIPTLFDTERSCLRQIIYG